MATARRSKNTRTTARQVVNTPANINAKPEKELASTRSKETSFQKPSTLWNDSFGKLAIRSLQGLIILLSLIALIYGMLQLHIIIVPILIALIMASAIHPLVSFMVRKNVPRVLATAISLISGFVIFGGIITMVVLGIKSQWSLLSSSFMEGVTEVQKWLSSGNSPIDAAQLDTLKEKAGEFLSSSSFTSGAVAGAGSVFGGITSLLLGIVILFFFVKDGPKIWNFILKPLPVSLEEKAKRVGVRSVQVLGGYVNGTALIALVDALLIGIGLWVLQVPLALPLAVIVFIGAFIPIVGASAAGAVAALVALVTNDLQTAIIVIIIVMIVNQLEGNFLAPVVLGKSLALHELVILLALSAGAILGGIIGTLLSVPIAAVIWAAVKAWKEVDKETLSKTKVALNN